uniref:Uncharacterized protein n=1 Tax=Panagrellus redivivus TaxID=6233 RepID=A0A7E4VP34_PANRE
MTEMGLHGHQVYNAVGPTMFTNHTLFSRHNHGRIRKQSCRKVGEMGVMKSNGMRRVTKNCWLDRPGQSELINEQCAKTIRTGWPVPINGRPVD